MRKGGGAMQDMMSDSAVHVEAFLTLWMLP
jgi:hypothetical protein